MIRMAAQCWLAAAVSRAITAGSKKIGLTTCVRHLPCRNHSRCYLPLTHLLRLPRRTAVWHSFLAAAPCSPAVDLSAIALPTYVQGSHRPLVHVDTQRCRDAWTLTPFPHWLYLLFLTVGWRGDGFWRQRCRDVQQQSTVVRQHSRRRQLALSDAQWRPSR